MDSVFVVEHLHTHDDGEECWKRIGIYRTRGDALEAINRATKLPGFCEYPGLIDHSNPESIHGFNIDECQLNVDHWVEGFSTV